jgi:hypothetical protein
MVSGSEVEGQTVDDAKSKLKLMEQQTACVIREEIISDGRQEDLTETVLADNDAEALHMVQVRMPTGSTVLSSNVHETTEETETEILADTYPDASALAQAGVEPWESTRKTLVGVRCVTEPQKGFLGMHKHSGTFLAKYRTTSREVHLAYHEPARVRVLYGPTALICPGCGQPMTTTTGRVPSVGGSPYAEDVTVELRCAGCGTTRLEKRWEIEGEWIDWEDGSPPTVL